MGTILWTYFFFLGLVCLSKTDPKYNVYFLIWSSVSAEGREEGSWQSAKEEAIEFGRSVTKKTKVFSFKDSLFENLSDLERVV